ncbi:hypothetical protein MIR68_010937 [Amoeboaphelidium protococcarum]|nr:hypothetical protein MIR68_011102 [Amoeboaphelidium protococcarum]KAI3631447.1 hypothetical protein MIR68_010937 [Amoeboaphelidium protococcarum]KAI3642051.1 hypothetical protein MP228_011606 [Amoeboaphelidium protococcarum]KAI3647294.1 hypothetical protein MP228_007515 [Amoeboaphelidium protococcarum]
MVNNRYNVVKVDENSCAKARGAYLRVHFKNTRETAMAVKDMNVHKALQYLEAVKEHKRCIPFRRFKGGVGRTGQALEFGVTQGRWPVKSVKFIEGLLKNALANAEAKQLDTDSLYIKHIQVNQAPKQRRRTYRAHGRINPFQSHPCHIEIVCVPRSLPVPAAKDSKKPVAAVTGSAPAPVEGSTA